MTALPLVETRLRDIGLWSYIKKGLKALAKRREIFHNNREDSFNQEAQ